MLKIIDDKNEGMAALLGKKITLLCANYFYTGILEGVNKTEIKLTDPSIVYETGDWGKKEWADAQRLPTSALYIRLAAVEAYGELK